jgi:SAM-dependent methyltransferase
MSGGDQRVSSDGGTQMARRADFASMADIVTPWAVRVAATLRLADHVAAGRKQVHELAAAAGANPDALARLMRYLACRGIFTEDGSGGYSLTPAGRLLQDRSGFGLRGALDLEGFYGRQDRLFANLLEAVRSGEPVYEAMYGRPFWADIEAQPELASQFHTMMVEQATRVARAVAATFDWRDARHVVDVGGGTGTMLAVLLTVSPHLRGTLVDLPSAAVVAEETIAAAGLSGRCEVVAQSFFEPLPPGADIYLLSEVIHDWDDKDSARLLCRCADAAGTGGRILLVEALAGSGDLDQVDSTALDLRMLVSMGGRERTTEQIGVLLESAGLAVSQQLQIPGRTLLECSVTGKSRGTET